MKVKELIKELNKFDENDNVQVLICNNNKLYPVAYVNITSVLNTIKGTARINVYLPNGMHTVERKVKN